MFGIVDARKQKRIRNNTIVIIINDLVEHELYQAVTSGRVLEVHEIYSVRTCTQSCHKYAKMLTINDCIWPYEPAYEQAAIRVHIGEQMRCVGFK